MDQTFEEIIMQAFLFLVIFSFSLIALFATNSAVFAQNTFELDKSAIVMPCLPGRRTRLDSCGNGTSIKITTKSPEKVEYKVSGGKLVGVGAEIEWDLSQVKAGTYEISANFYDSQNSYQTLMKSVTVRECPDCGCGLCECPSISVSASEAAVKLGDFVTLVANVSGGSQTDIEYLWKISDGKIIEGQGTPVIQVETKDIKGTSILVEIELVGLCDGCGKVESLRIDVVKPNQQSSRILR